MLQPFRRCLLAKGFSTRAIHTALRKPEHASRPISTPIYQTASFAFDDVDGMATTLAKPESGFMYSRVSNPTIDVLERTVADLEEAPAGIAFGSGMAAIHAAFLAVCGAGDHVVAARSLYGGTFALLKNVLSRIGVESTFVDATDAGAVKAAMRANTKLVYGETIGNPALVVTDIAALAEVAHAGGAKLVIDSTFASPWLCRPVTLGADVVVHSATKYLGGHGDVIAGVAAGSAELVAKMRRVLIDVGGMADPFSAWLVLRGIKTLSVRMERHCSNALAIARFLEKHPKVTKTIHPALASHPQHALAKRMLPRGGGGMVACELAGGRAAGLKAMERLQVFLRAGSLGDVHSLAMLPSATSHRQMSPAELAAAGISEGFLRLSVGLEDEADLIADLEGALA